MKKLVVGCIAVVTFGFAEGYTLAERILDMQKMAQAMQDMQSGFFYNNQDMVKAGADDLKNTITKIGPIKKGLWMSDKNLAVVKHMQSTIEHNSDDIIECFSTGDKRQALQVYDKISSDCIKCHTNLH